MFRWQRISTFSAVLFLCASAAVIKNHDDNELEDDTIDLSALGPMIYGRPSEDTGRQLERWYERNGPGNAEEQGSYFEGDILFPSGMLRNGLMAQSKRWPDGVVPVEIENTFSEYSTKDEHSP